MNITRKVLIILGPTAIGKTDLAFHLAKRLGGELVACDSRQIYQGLDIGTGKLPKGISNFELFFKLPSAERISNFKKADGRWIINGITIWMYDVVSPKKQYTVYDFVRGANKVIQDITTRGKLPIVVGGTGLYLKALLGGLPNLGIPVDQKLRNNLRKLSLSQLQNKLQNLSPKRWEEMNESDRNNPRRLVRAIEIAIADDRNATAVGKMSTVENITDQTEILKIGLTARRNILYEKINKRVYEWIEDGILDEVKSLIKKGTSKKRFKELGLEYGVISDYIDGRLTFDQLINKMQTKVRQYAKRQQTWFKKEKDVQWFGITEKRYQHKIEKVVAEWYD